MKNDEKNTECCGKWKGHHHHRGGSSNAIYSLGVIGALFYFVKGATTFWPIVMGIGKAFFWPALLMFRLLTYLKM